MKKILSAGILALVALAAAVLTSCSKDDEKSDSFTFRCSIGCQVESDQISDAVISAYKTLLGSDATVEKTSESYVFNIKCSESNKEAVWNKIQNATMTDLTTALDKLHKASYVSVHIYYGTSLKDYRKTYEYQMALSSFLPGTYTATAEDGAVLTIMFTTPTDNKYKAMVTVGGTTYTASSFEVTKDSFGPTVEFHDDTNALHFVMAADLYGTFEDGFDRFVANVTVGEKEYFAAEFKRNK